LGFGPTPGKILPKKLQKEEEGGDWTMRPWGAGRWRRLSARAISTWRAIKTAVWSVASVVKRCAMSQTPPAKILKINHDGAEKNRDLLLAQAHCCDRITDPPQPAKLKARL
jgi:hypothetical protein